MRKELLETAVAWAMIGSVVGGLFLFVDSRSKAAQYDAGRCLGYGLAADCSGR